MLKKFMVLGLSAMFLVGCGSVGYDLETASKSNRLRDINGREVYPLMEIGKKIDVELVRMDGDSYVVGYLDDKGTLLWHKETRLEKMEIRIIEGLKNAYIERIENEVRNVSLTGNGDQYEPQRAQYFIYVPKDSGIIKGGSFEENCGKNCTETVDTEIIYQ